MLTYQWNVPSASRAPSCGIRPSSPCTPARAESRGHRLRALAAVVCSGPIYGPGHDGLLLVLAIGAKWAVIHGPTRVLFGALAMLGAYLVCTPTRPAHPGEWLAEPSARYVAHIGFTLIALADAFVVILVLHLGAPVWNGRHVGRADRVGRHVALRAVQAQQSATAMWLQREPVGSQPLQHAQSTGRPGYHESPGALGR